MLKICILGAGNVAFHLAKMISKDETMQLIQMYNRSDFSHHFKEIKTQKINNLNDLKPADIYFLCVKDDVISSFSNDFPFENRLVVHTSGNTDILQISPKNRRGVLYPVQSFSKDKEMNFTQIPLCLETEFAEDMPILTTFAKKISQKVYFMNSLQRKYLHISAVFLNNFANHLWYLSAEICKKNDIDFEILKPLFLETFEKTQLLSFHEAQTGPAKRNDTATIETHLSLLESFEKDIYKTITNSILNTYGTEKL